MRSRPQKTYFVYIMTNRSKTLYIGVTNSLVRRVREHKLGIGSSFAAKYKLDRLAYFERFDDIRNAIEREKANKRLAAHQEDCPDSFRKSRVEGSERGVVRETPVPARASLV